jgi:hypothetical protein
MEGKRLWIIGLAPLGLPQVLRIKFWLASRAALLVSLGLILLSCALLRIPFGHTLYLGLIIGAMTFSLTASGDWTGRALSQFPRGKSGEDRQRLRRHALFGGQFSLHCRLRHPAGHGLALGLARGNSVAWVLGSWAGFAASRWRWAGCPTGWACGAWKILSFSAV